MKKAGAVAIRLGVHPDTIRDWADTFEEFFSESAKKGAEVRRVFSLGDEIILNTICEMRKRNVEFEEIRARLRSGERIEVLPAINEPIPQENALEIYTEMKELRVQIADRDAEIQRLRAELANERNMTQERIATLREEMAVLKYRLEQREKSE